MGVLNHANRDALLNRSVAYKEAPGVVEHTSEEIMGWGKVRSGSLRRGGGFDNL
jgi:hypothetical protein